MRAVRVPHVAAISDPCDDDLDLHESGFGDLDLTVVGQGGKPGWSSSLGRGCMRMGDGFMDISLKKSAGLATSFAPKISAGLVISFVPKIRIFFLNKLHY